MKTPRFTQLETPRLRIRRFRARDLKAFVAYRNHPQVTRFQGFGETEFTLQDGQEFIARMRQANPGQPGWFQFALEHRDTRSLIGDCAFHTTDLPETFEIGYSLDPAWWGQGLATEALRAVLDHAFDTLGMHRGIAWVAVPNRKSKQLLERLGFRREGRTRQSYRFHGVWHDEYLYAMLKEDWREARKSRRARKG